MLPSSTYTRCVLCWGVSVEARPLSFMYVDVHSARPRAARRYHETTLNVCFLSAIAAPGCSFRWTNTLALSSVSSGRVDRALEATPRWNYKIPATHTGVEINIGRAMEAAELFNTFFLAWTVRSWLDIAAANSLAASTHSRSQQHRPKAETS